MDADISETVEDAQLALGAALRGLREKAGISQLELSQRTGAHNSYISQVEAGLRDIRWSTITRLLVGLEASIEDLASEITRSRESRQG